MENNLCYVALGSNLNNPIKQIETALAHLKKIPQTNFDKVSSLYSSKPLHNLPHPNYLNAVCCLYTKLSAPALLFELQQIEKNQGRIRHHIQMESRTIDLDLLLYNQEIINLPDLQIPHPRMKTRDFVLIPLAELDANLEFPDGEKINVLIENLTEKNLFSLRRPQTKIS